MQKYYNDSFDPKWTALLVIQENSLKFNFKQWKKYIDTVVLLLIDKESGDLKDLPYWELWDHKTNPLLVAMYAIYNSSEGDKIITCDKLDIKKEIDFRKTWEQSEYFNFIHKKIDFIMKDY